MCIIGKIFYHVTCTFTFTITFVHLYKLHYIFLFLLNNRIMLHYNLQFSSLMSNNKTIFSHEIKMLLKTKT